MQIKNSLKFGYELLKKNNIDSFILDTEIILSFVIKKNKEWILSNPDFVLHNNAYKKFIKLINKRSKNYPIAYILGYKYFYGLNFKVNKNVLIPRPETELLIDSIQRPTLKILDIGTGSGCIAISLGKKLKNAQIIATDISQLALNMAKKNAKLNNVKNIKFIKSNLFKNIKDRNFDAIIANLPYVKKSWNDKSIKYEPKCALYSGKLGLNHYFRLLEQIKKYEINTKYIFLEIDPEQVEKLKEKTTAFFPNSKIQIKKDLNSLDRVFIIKL